MRQAETRPTLDELALAHGTDKSSAKHAFTEIYEAFLSSWRDLPVTVMEIGVLRGASVRMWKDYFPNGRIIGVDLARAATQHADDRIEIFIGNQADRAFLEQVATSVGELDLVVDDGGHHQKEQLNSLFALWRHVKPGGLYVVEDVHTSYLAQWGMEYGQTGTTIDVLKSIVDDVNVFHHGQGETLPGVGSIHFFFETCVLRKRAPNEGPLWLRAVQQRGGER